MQKFQDKIQLIHLMQQGAGVICPNNRLAASVVQTYFEHDNKNTQVKPFCLPYKQMLLTIFDTLRFNDREQQHPLLLNEIQCRYLWQTIIQKTKTITYSQGLLHSVMQAWKHCEQWLIEPSNLQFAYTPQTQCFQNWWTTFTQHLKQLHAISEYQLVSYLINSKKILSSQPLIWLCFDEFTPAQIQLQNHLHAQNVLQYQYDLAENSVRPMLLAAENTKEEYQQLIHYLKQNLQQEQHTHAVVVPELEKEAPYLKRLFKQHFASHLFNISLGEPLNNYPLIAHALTWLSLGDSLTTQQADLLLQSPYLAGAKEEFLSRAQLLQDSTLIQQVQFTLSQFIQQLTKYAPLLADCLSNLAPYPDSAAVNEWINLFHARLNHLGFPGELGLNSAQYQYYQRFVVLFDELRHLNLIKTQFTKEEALLALSQLASNTIFQIQKNNAPIQILGLLEASGCEFDAIWVTGLHDQCLPGTTQLSAFIPPQLQRDLFMPHSSATRELHFAQQTLDRLQRGSSTVIFSYAQLDGDKPNLPCTLISHFPPLKHLVVGSSKLESALIKETEIYLLPVPEEEPLKGGSALLANQAKCPFKAFAEHRLKAKPILNPVESIDNKERGKTLHKILELLWLHLNNQEQLINYDPQQLELLIDKVIQQALQEQELNVFVQNLEQIRLKRLILSYLNWEKQRPPFIIEALEKSYSFNLSGLEINLRVDRLDKVAEKKWVLDYKSSLPSTKPWNDERPQEPQLLLYALLDEEINTLILMQIKTGKILCSGLSEESLEIKGISSLKKEMDWEETRQQWHEQLSNLALEIIQGYCPPQPNNSSICSYCDFQNLCRIES